MIYSLVKYMRESNTAIIKIGQTEEIDKLLQIYGVEFDPVYFYFINRMMFFQDLVHSLMEMFYHMRRVHSFY